MKNLEDVIDYWFKKPSDESKWFRANSETDRYIIDN